MCVCVSVCEGATTKNASVLCLSFHHRFPDLVNEFLFKKKKRHR